MHNDEEHNDEEPGVKPPLLRRILSILTGGILTLTLASLLLRFTLSDRFFPLNYNSYMPGLVYLVIALVLPWVLPFRWWNRGIFAMILLVAAGFSIHQEHPLLLKGGNPATTPAGEDSITMLTWNVQAYHGGMDEVIATIREVDPDILCLVEGTFGDRAPDQVRRALGREYQWAVGRRLSIASRIPILESQQATLSRSMWSFRAVVEPIDGEPFALILVDVNPPFRRREGEVFRELWTLRSAETLPLVMTGDFNTPRHSARLRHAIGPDLRNAVEEMESERWLATWPTWGLPLWQLDYSFIGQEFDIHRAEFLRTRVSDHHGIIVNFSPK